MKLSTSGYLGRDNSSKHFTTSSSFEIVNIFASAGDTFYNFNAAEKSKDK